MGSAPPGGAVRPRAAMAEIYFDGDNWRTGCRPQFTGSLALYRRYLVLHEVGHALGYKHASPGSDPAAPCSVMYQQSKGTASCAPSAAVGPEYRRVRGRGVNVRFARGQFTAADKAEVRAALRAPDGWAGRGYRFHFDRRPAPDIVLHLKSRKEMQQRFPQAALQGLSVAVVRGPMRAAEGR